MTEAVQPGPKPFDEVGGALSLDFVNTASAREAGPLKERLETYADLLRWALQVGVIGEAEHAALSAQAAADPAGSGAAVERARALRETIYDAFHCRLCGRDCSTEAQKALNRAQAVAAARRTLVLGVEGASFAWPSPPASLEQPLWPIAIDAAELLVSGDASRVKECGTSNCNWLFLDATKNRSRRWCEMRECGNREKARRHYARRRVVADRDAGDQLDNG